MKLRTSIIGFAGMLITTAWTAPTPENEGIAGNASVTVNKEITGDFSFVRVHRQGKGITTTWGVGTGQGIVGFQVQKTYEDPNDEYAVWEDVCSVPYTGARSYKHTDNNVFPGYINYRVIALKSDGASLSSGVATARIVSH